MTTTKHLGIWLDHTGADLIEATVSPAETKTFASKFTHFEKEENMDESEYLIRNKKKHEEEKYYQDLGELIGNYDHIILFGPTDAKIELFYILKADQRFAHTRIKLETTDKMSDDQKHAFVSEYFS